MVDHQEYEDVYDCLPYYRLPCGLYLEDFIAYKELPFADGCALKYLYRAGYKPHESEKSAKKKAAHYIGAIAARWCIDYDEVERDIINLLDEARAWSGCMNDEQS